MTDIEVLERARGKIAVVTINGLEPNNTLNLELLRGFMANLEAAGQKADAVLVTSGHEKFFSNGLDGKTLLEADVPRRKETITEMIQAFGKMIRFGKPWAVAIAGHAMAGGAVISCAADYRFMMAKSGRIGFSELAVGLPLPLVYMHGMHRVVHPSAVRRMMEGAAYKPEEALELGFVDGVAADREALMTMALKRLDTVLRLNQATFLPTRALYRGALLREIERDEPEDIRQAMELIGTPAFEEAIRNIAGKNR